jgi:peptide chain release factor 1
MTHGHEGSGLVGKLDALARIEDTVALYRRYLRVLDDIAGSREILETEEDRDLKKLAEEELASLEEAKVRLEKELTLALIPKDPNDDKDVIVEIRAGTGGEEAALFAAELFRMYGRYAEDRRWKTEILTSNPTDLGGFKEIIFAIEGKGAYRRSVYPQPNREVASTRPLPPWPCFRSQGM